MPNGQGGHATVEQVIRSQLSHALGGKRGMVESAVPTIAFTVCWVASHQLRLSLLLGVCSALVLVAARLLQRGNIRYVMNSLVGIGVAAIFALSTGEAEDAFLPGIIYNAGYAAVMLLTIALRWPLLGFIVGGVTGDPTGWHRDRGTVRLCSRLTWLLVLPCVLRVVVQYPLWAAGETGWLGLAKIGMGWPLQVLGLLGMVWLLSRNRTPLDRVS